MTIVRGTPATPIAVNIIASGTEYKKNARTSVFIIPEPA